MAARKTSSTSKKRSRAGSRGGKGHVHSGKAKRMAQHVASSERKRGMSSRRAKQVAWATVHKDMSHGQRDRKHS